MFERIWCHRLPLALILMIGLLCSSCIERVSPPHSIIFNPHHGANHNVVDAETKRKAMQSSRDKLLQLRAQLDGEIRRINDRIVEADQYIKSERFQNIPVDIWQEIFYLLLTVDKYDYSSIENVLSIT